MQIRMKYGKNGLNFNLPDNTGIAHIQKRIMPFMMDPVAGVHHALSHPVASKKLIQEARGCHNACILICDITRPVPNGVILPVLIRELLKAGLSPSSITVIVATGLHRPNEGEELRELVGDDWVLNTVKIVNHFARNDDEHVDLGVTKDGMTIKIDHRFVRADLRRAPLYGRILRRQKGRSTWNRAQGHNYRISYGEVPRTSKSDELRSRRQPVA